MLGKICDSFGTAQWHFEDERASWKAVVQCRMTMRYSIFSAYVRLVCSTQFLSYATRLFAKICTQMTLPVSPRDKCHRNWKPTPGFTRSYVLGKKVGESGRSEFFEATIRGSPTGSQLYSVKRTAREGLNKKHEKQLCEEVREFKWLGGAQRGDGYCTHYPAK